ncbi:hypothetical protein SCYAM73S_03003 [Streptomyces cyaneofuscatus]
MKKPSYLWAAGLAVALLGPVPAAAAAPGDVTATERTARRRPAHHLRGRSGRNAHQALPGGTHDGKTVV